MPASHGGSIALSGYLFQLLAVTGVQVSPGPGQKKAPDGEAFVVFHEWLDEDAAIADPSTKSVTFVQVKYSENAQAAKISTGELKQIVKSFAKATNLALKKNWDVSGYLLLSNRGLSDPSKRLLEFSEESVKKGKGTVTKPKASDSWPKTEKHVAAGLVDLLISTEEVTTLIRSFAAKYGVLDDEFTKATGQLISTIFTEVGGLRDSGMTHEALVKMLTGTKDAISLERSEQKAKQEAELVKIKPYDEEPREHLPRESTTNLFDRYPQYTLFIFHGKGGMGKSASLHELARNQAKRLNGPFIKGVLAIDAMAHWASECADNWRNVQVPAEGGTIERAIERLKTANAVIRPPILFIALDGIDDKFEHEATRDLRELLTKLKDHYASLKPASASDFKLVVTCRDLETLEKYLPHDSSDVDEQPLAWMKAIELNSFDADEFRKIVERDAKEFLNRLAPVATISASLGSLSGEQAARNEQTLASARYQYLRDPLVWRQFLALKPEQQKDLLDEKGDAAFKLGEKIFKRFVKKVLKRRSDLDRRTLLTTMKAAATKMDEQPTPWTRNDWCAKGKATGESTEKQCLAIFAEAYEAGLIDGNLADWNWRNFAIPTYLKNATV